VPRSMSQCTTLGIKNQYSVNGAVPSAVPLFNPFGITERTAMNNRPPRPRRPSWVTRLKKWAKTVAALAAFIGATVLLIHGMTEVVTALHQFAAALGLV
jgi:hypothetical protein